MTIAYTALPCNLSCGIIRNTLYIMITNINIFTCICVNIISALTPEMGADSLLVTTTIVVKFSYSNHTCKKMRYDIRINL